MTDYSTNLNIALLDANSASPEVPVDAAIEALDAKITGKVVVAIGASNTATLTQDEQAAGTIFVLTDVSPSATGPVSVNFAAFGMGLFCVQNSLAMAATLQISGQPLTPPVLSAGAKGSFYCDGINVVEVASGGSGSGNVPAGGSTGDVLTKASNADYDADWQAPGGGGGLTLIDTLSPTGNAASFTGITGSYGSLILVGHGRSATAAAMTDSIRLQFNADAGSNYSKSRTLGYSGTAIVAEDTDSDVRLSDWPSSTGIASYAGSLRATIPFYALTAFKKTLLWDSIGFEGNTLGDMADFHGGAVWNNTAAINRIDIFLGSGDNFESGTKFSLYGMP